jgi:protein-S-isoprenylcysteine O-methyltransferase Ste14
VASVLFMIGAVVAAVLLTVLVLTMLFPQLRIWPTPGPGSWQSYVFWPLFRGLNVLCFATALIDHTSFLGLPIWLRGCAAILLAASLALFIYSFRVLGRDNSYGAQAGLVTGGIYRWTRNPQNAMLVVGYASLAFAADSGPTYVLCAAMMAVYVLMVLLEEPWLETIYGAPYRRYCARVPRFFNWRRLALCARSGVWARASARRSPRHSRRRRNEYRHLSVPAHLRLRRGEVGAGHDSHRIAAADGRAAHGEGRHRDS